MVNLRSSSDSIVQLTLFGMDVAPLVQALVSSCLARVYPLAEIVADLLHFQIASMVNSWGPKAGYRIVCQVQNALNVSTNLIISCVALGARAKLHQRPQLFLGQEMWPSVVFCRQSSRCGPISASVTV